MLSSFATSRLTVFISYLWDKKAAGPDVVRSFAKRLCQDNKLNVWLDRKETTQTVMSDNRMVEGIERADVVMIYFNEAYKNSKYLKKEVEYVDSKKKPTVGVKVGKLEDWLEFQLGDRFWVDFDDPCFDEVAIYQLFAAFESSKRTEVRFINAPNMSDRYYRFRKEDLPMIHGPSYYLNKVEAICQAPAGKGGLLVVSGDKGVGKKAFISQLLENSKAYLKEECKIGTVLWRNCYHWRDEKTFDNESRRQIQNELLELVAKSTKRGLQLDFQRHIKILTSKFDAPPMFVFTDVHHLHLLVFLRVQCGSMPGIVIIDKSDEDAMRASNETIWNRLVDPDNLVTVGHWQDSVIKAILNGWNENSTDAEVKKCNGMPVEAKLLVERRREAQPRPETNHLNVSPVGPWQTYEASGGQSSDGLPELILKGVPEFDYQFTRIEEEEVIVNGIGCLTKKAPTEKGYLVVEGCGGIGKSTLVSHVLRDERYKTFFQRECNMQIVIWVNCYKFDKGSDFYSRLLDLSAQVDPDNLINDGSITLKTIKEMLAYFAEKKMRILFVLDDIVHPSLLSDLSQACGPDLLCVAITRDAQKLKTPKFDPVLKMEHLGHHLLNPVKVPYFTLERQAEIFGDYGGEDLRGILTDDQLSALSRLSSGTPMNVALIASYFRNCSNNVHICNKLARLALDRKLGGRGNEEYTGSELVQAAIYALDSVVKKRFCAFQLFDPAEEIEPELLQKLWGVSDVKDVVDICTDWERLSIVCQSSKRFFVNRIVHEAALKMAVAAFPRSGKPDKLQLSRLRICILCGFAKKESGGDMASMLSSLQRLPQNYRATILQHISNEAYAEFQGGSQSPSPDSVQDLLLTAAAIGSGYLVNYLIGSVQELDEDGWTVFSMAVEKGHDHIVEQLLSKSSSKVDTDDYRQRLETALFKAVRKGYEKIVDFIITKGNISAETVNDDGRTVLMLASAYGQDQVVQLLLSKYRASVAAVDKDGRTPLMIAAKEGYDKVVEPLISIGKAHVELVDNDGSTALMIAAKFGREKVADQLISIGKAQFETADRDDKTALLIAAEQGNGKVVDVLVSKYKAKVDVVDRDGETALIKAAKNGYDKVVELLVTKCKAKVDVIEPTLGRTALMWAASNGHENVANVLLNKGKANVEISDKNGWTALIMAIENQHDKVAEVIKSKTKTKPAAKAPPAKPTKSKP